MKSQHLYKLIWLSRPLMQAAEACVEAGLAGSKLTVRMRAVLEILRNNGDLSVPELALKLDIKRQYVQLMVNDTLASGLTVQRANPRHKRSPRLALTDQGRRVIDAVVAREMALVDTIAEEFSDQDMATALKVVEAVTEALKSQGNGS